MYSGPMTDYFELQGAAGGAVERLPGAVHDQQPEPQPVRPINAFGDPIDFETGTARCDPL